MHHPERAHDRAATRHALVGPAELWEMKRRFQIGFLRAAGLLPGHRLLDLGCGTLRGGIPLIEYLDVGHYCGVEVRSAVLAEGQRELQESGLEAKAPQLVHCGHLDRLDLGMTFDYVWAFAVLIHMDDAILHEALAAVSRHLGDDGVFYATVNVGGQAPGTWQGFPVVHRSADFYADAFRRHGLRFAHLGPLTDHGHVDPRLPVAQQAHQRMLRGTRATGGGPA